jgi:hypothetical protein
MRLWRRLTAAMLAAATFVGPAGACAQFCPETDGARVVAPAEDCAEAMAAEASHDPDCQGCSDCPAVAAAKSPALAPAGAVPVEAPAVAAVELSDLSAARMNAPPRLRPTPPSHGPPAAATPVARKDILRL